MKILFSIIFNAIILYILAFFLEERNGTGVIIANGNFDYNNIGAIKTYIIGGTILGLINLIIKPILKILAIPLFLIFYSFVSLIVNGIVLYLLDFIMTKILIINQVGFHISGTIEFAIATIIFTILNIFYSILFFKK